MEIINSILGFITKMFQWWFTVMPWEQAIHVRKGKIVKLRNAGLYFKIPFIDSVYIQTSRMRMIDVPMQTMSAKDGSTITIKSCIGYSISDILTLYKTLYHPEITLGSMVQGFVAEYVCTNSLKDISPTTLESEVNSKIKAIDYGLKDISVRITTFAVVKTYRLMQDNSNIWENLTMDPKK